MNEEYKKLFISAGLSPEQAQVYDILLRHKELQASRLSKLAKLERSFVYKILNQLIELKLVQKREPKGEVAKFTAEHPQRILEIIDENRKLVENSYRNIQDNIGEIIAEYNLTIGKPSIRFSEGIEGLSQLHNDIMDGKQRIKLFRSVLDKTVPKNKELIQFQRETRIKQGLTTKIIGPLPSGKNTDVEKQKKEDREFLVDRRVIDDFEVPAQILIYGNKVAITDYKNNVITTTIESQSVRETFEKIFDYMFETSRKL